MKFLKILLSGLFTGLFLQLAIGPVFFYILNLTLQKSLFDGLVGVLAVTLVDFFYISLAILGVGKLMESKKFKKKLGVLSSVVLVIFGLFIIYEGFMSGVGENLIVGGGSLWMSFFSVFIITVSSPLTIVFFTSIFTAKMIELKYSKNELWVFGFAVGLATFLFMSSLVFSIYFMKGSISVLVVQSLNLIVGFVLVSYGIFRFRRFIRFFE